MRGGKRALYEYALAVRNVPIVYIGLVIRRADICIPVDVEIVLHGDLLLHFYREGEAGGIGVESERWRESRKDSPLAPSAAQGSLFSVCFVEQEGLAALGIPPALFGCQAENIRGIKVIGVVGFD